MFLKKLTVLYNDVMVQLLKNISLAILILLVTFVGLLVLVCMIPSNMVTSRFADTVTTLQKEGLYPSVGLSWRKIVLDNFTDGVMLNIAYSVDSSDPVRSAIRNVQFDGNEGSADQILNLEKLQQHRDVHETVYERYWHGYLVFLRPLLAITSYAGVRLVMTVALLTLFAVFMYTAWKVLGVRIALGLLIGFVAVDFFWLGSSIQLSNVFFTGMLGSLFLLKRKKLSFTAIGTVFFVTGAVTSFIDVLSAPLVGLGLLLVVTIGLVRKIDLKKVVFLCVLWSVGYLGLWVSKWVIAEHTYVPSATSIGYRKVQDRTMGRNDEGFSMVTMLQRNVYQLRGYDKRDKIVLLVLGMCYFAFMLRYFSSKFVNVKRLSIWFLVAMIPYAWYLIAAEHSYVHVLFTYRNQFITVVALFLASTEFVNPLRIKDDWLKLCGAKG